MWSRGEGRGSGVRDGKGQTNSGIEIWVCGRVSESLERVTVHQLKDHGRVVASAASLGLWVLVSS